MTIIDEPGVIDGGRPNRPMTVDWNDPVGRRIAIGQTIVGLELPDAVLRFLLIEERHPSPANVPAISLSDMLPDADPTALVEWMRAAVALVRDAAQYGRRHTQGGETGLALIGAMGVDHPGFSAKSYGEVLFHGFSLAAGGA